MKWIFQEDRIRRLQGDLIFSFGAFLFCPVQPRSFTTKSGIVHPGDADGSLKPKFARLKKEIVDPKESGEIPSTAPLPP